MKKVNKRLIVYSVFFIFLILSTPLLPAVELNLVRDTLKEKISINNKFPNFLNFKNKINTNIQNLLNLESNSDILTNKDFPDKNMVMLDFILLLLFLFIIFKGIPTLFQNISRFIISLVSNISILLANILTFIYDTIVFLGETSLTILIGLVQIIFKIAEVLGIAAFSIIVGIVSVIVLVIFVIIYGIVIGVSFIWNAIEIFLGLILDILRLIYQAIFQPWGFH